MDGQAQGGGNLFRAPCNAWFDERCDRLAAGTHLIVRRLGYTHHGIYLGRGRVVHYAGHIRFAHGLIEETSIEEFAAGKYLHAGISAAGQFDAEEVVRRARSRLGERRYDLLRNNCEHFCNWCRLGENRSSQVERLMMPLRLLRGAVTQLSTGYRSLRHAATAVSESRVEHAT